MTEIRKITPLEAHQMDSGPTLPIPHRDEPTALVLRLLGSGASMEMIEKSIALQERWEANQARKAYTNALADASSEMPILKKNKLVDYKSTKSETGRVTYKHEDLSEVVGKVAPILSKYGLSHRWRVVNKPGDPVVVTCIISHRDGHSEENTLSAAPDGSGGKNPIQMVKSTVTYLQRITLEASLGLAAAEDDDGRAAGGGEVEKVPTITQAQADELRELIEVNKKDRKVFIEWGKRDYGDHFERFEDIPATHYENWLYAAKFKKEEPKK